MNPDPHAQALLDRRERHLEKLRAGRHGLTWCHEHSDIADELVSSVAQSVFGDGEAQVAIVATGGYGRREVAPHSDLDVTVTALDEAMPGLDSLIRTLFQRLHAVINDQWRTELGYSFRLVGDLPGLDPKSRTGLLEGRLVWGSPGAFKALERAVWETHPAGEFLLAKMGERLRAHTRFHDTPLVVEPHLKEGAGGLRDFQCASWIRLSIGEKSQKPNESYETLIAARNSLQHFAGRCSDLLTKGRQEEIAAAWGLNPIQLMDLVLPAAMQGAAHYSEARQRINQARFLIGPSVEAVKGRVRLSSGCNLSQAAAGAVVGAELGLNIGRLAGPELLEVNGPEAVHALTRGLDAIRAVDAADLLERLLPELTRCKTVIPGDSAHRYTVFEHTLRVVGNLDSQAKPAFLHPVADAIADRRPLYLAALLHDLGKALPGEPHSISGERLARGVCKRWQMSERFTDLVAWLVRHHLALSDLIRLRDIANPASAHEAAALIKSRESLDMLTLLTWADAAAVSPEVWTPAQTHQLRELYERTASVLEEAHRAPPDAAVYRRRLLRELRSSESDEASVKRFLDSMPAHYVVSVGPELARLHLSMIERAKRGEVLIELFDQNEPGLTDITVACPDAPGLLSKALAVLYAHDLSIHGLRAGTTSDAQPAVLDVFSVSFAGRVLPPATAQAAAASLKAVLSGSLDPDELLRKMGKDPMRRQQVFTYRYLPGSPGILEVQAPRGRGMAYRLSRLIAANGWNIVAARVGQWAGRGTAAFYLEGASPEVVEALLKGHVQTV